MAYEIRAQELRQRFELFKATLKPEDFAALGLLLDAFLAAREAGLLALGELLADKGDSLRGATYNSKLDEVSRAQLALIQNLLLNYKDPPPNLTAFRDIAAAEEQKFWDGLKRAKAGDARDAQMAACQALDGYTAIMRIHWSTLSDTEKDLLQKERYYAAQLRETVKKAFDEAVTGAAATTRDGLDYLTTPDKVKKYIDDKYKELRSSLASRVGADSSKIDAFLKKLEEDKASIKSAAEQAGLDPDVVDKVLSALTSPGGLLYTMTFAGLTVLLGPVAAVGKGTVKAAKTLEKVAQSVVDQQAAEMRTMMGGRQIVIVSFSGTRREAAQYVQTSGYDQAKDLYQANKRLLDDWQSSLNGALQTNARTLSLRADEANAYFLEKMRQIHSAFIDEFKGILVESVSDQTIDVLADRPFWEEWGNGIDQIDADQQLRRLYDQINDLHGNIERAFGQMDAFTTLPVESQAMIQAMVRKCVDEVNQPFTKDMQDALAALESAKGKQPASVLKSVKDAAIALARQAAGV